jgi:hypothetical protein
MKLDRIVLFCTALLLFGLGIISCQKLERPELTELILDPPPPPYNALKSYWSFENNVTDAGENKFTGTAKNLTYTTGVSGQAIQVGPGGYLLLKGTGDTVEYENGFLGIPADTLRSLGSFTLSFWMNGVGPVQGGAQGLFSISNKNEFWGNLELFLENWDNGSEAFLKIHMFNAGVASGNGEEWAEVKIPNALNKWTHIALTYNENNSQMSVYADGQPTSVNNKTLGGGNYGKVKFDNVNGMVLGTFQFQTDPTLTNHGPETWAKSFNGALDQFRLYNRALSAAEVTELFNSKQ